MLRDNLAGLIEPRLNSAGAYPLALGTDRKESSDDRPHHALKILARQGGIYALTENVASPFHAEPRQIRLDCNKQNWLTLKHHDPWTGKVRIRFFMAEVDGQTQPSDDFQLPLQTEVAAILLSLLSPRSTRSRDTVLPWSFSTDGIDGL